MQSSTAADYCRLSLLKPIGYQPGDCGYCKNEDSSGSYYVVSKSLSPEHYQVLVDRGWRRSGTILYLPDVARSCCPHYTIRLPVTSFKPTRDQRQALNRWNRFILGEEYLSELNKTHPKTKAEKKKAHNTFDLIRTIHEPESTQIPSDLTPAHNLTITLEPDTYTDEKFALFQNYQTHVHHESPSEITPSSFRRFLCSSPLTATPHPTKPLGSYHQLYRLDNRLIALAVLDLLPHAVSGVYFIYHSDFSSHSLGKISALREAALALEGGYQFYYMGYYIHSCKKMRYKGDYRPQFVLDLGDYSWHEFDGEMARLMGERGYASLVFEREGRQGWVEEMGRMKPAEVPRRESLLALGMPGVMTAGEVEREIELDEVKVYLGKGGDTHQMQDLVGWDQGSIHDARTIKGIVAEMAACIGPEAAREMVIDFSH